MRINDIPNWKNFTIISILLIFIGFFPIFYPFYQNKDLFHFILDIGCLGFGISYFIYAVKCWEDDNRILAVFMIMVPFGAYFFSTTKIPESTNIVIYVVFLLGFFVIISTVLLFIGEKIKLDIEKNFITINSRNHQVSLPKISYAILGLICVSLLIINTPSTSVFINNFNSITQSITGYEKNSQYDSTSQILDVSQYPTVSIAVNRPTIQAPTAGPAKDYETGLTSKSFGYVLRGKSGSIDTNMYSGVYNEISSRSSPAACMRYNYDNSPCTTSELQQYYLKYLNDPLQKKDLDNLVGSIKSESPNQDDQVRIAISLVQNIPYDNKGLFSTNSKMRSPYAVLYENKGVCSEKSLLLAYLLREFGYGVVLFTFKSENHMAVGIKSPTQYSYKNSGYAFIESTTPSIPTDSEGDYIGAGKLTSTPEQYYISDGISFSSISEEYQDSIAFNQLGNGGEILAPEKYRQWEMLMWKYGLTTRDGKTVQKNPSDTPLCEGDRLCNGKCWEVCDAGGVWTCTPQGAMCKY